MRVFGLTGGIGSGKSTVAKVFECIGIPVFYADINAHEVLNSKEVIDALITRFGSEILIKGEVNRKILGKKVFNNEMDLKFLNNLVHPIVKRNFEEWKLKHSEFPYLLKEAAIIFETNGHLLLDGVISVVASAENRLKRVGKRDGRSTQEIKAIMDKQMNPDELEKRSDFVIYNNTEKLLPQIETIHKKLLNF